VTRISKTLDCQSMNSFSMHCRRAQEDQGISPI
jgi:hypothetical protein